MYCIATAFPQSLHSHRDQHQHSIGATRLHKRIAAGTSVSRTMEQRVEQLEYYNKILSSKLQNLEERNRMQDALIYELADKIKGNEGKVVNNLRDMGLIFLDLDFIHDNLDTIIKVFHR